MTVQHLAEAVRAGDIAQVRSILKVRPELVNMEMAYNNEHRAIHFAVLARAPRMVRVLMEHGANARKGIHPHCDATTALTLATERGYDEIVAIIREEEQHRREAMNGASAAVMPAQDDLSEAISGGDETRAIAM